MRATDLAVRNEEEKRTDIYRKLPLLRIRYCKLEWKNIRFNIDCE